MDQKIALGFGDNVDYEIVWNSGVIEGLIRQYHICNDELDVNRVITRERDLVISILGFMQDASGGERFVSSSDIVEQFSQRCEKKITVGGTSIRAAIAMRKFGYTSALHLVTLNDHVRRLIPHDSPYVCSNAQDSSYPHLIVQFGKDTRIKANDIDICTRHANRLIYHSDIDNIVMNLNEDFSDLMTDAKVLLVSGFNAMHSQTLLADRLASVLRMMERLPEDAVVFCEDAGYYEPKFSHIVYGTLANRMTILSLNEDELQGHLNTKLNLLDVFEVKEALVELQRLFPVPVIVVHTKHWALAYGEKAAEFSKALKAAVTMATTRFCYGDDFTVEQYKAVEALAPSPEDAVFADALNKLPSNRICCTPVAQVEPSVATTVGLGDAFVGGFLPALLTR
ncbi:MAG: ADP-dependent glucokinase/phosphofructokinase [Aggregatilineales bacterium]